MNEPATPAQGDASSIPTDAHSHGKFWPLVLGAIGVVYGDIGTSPLYALRECLHIAGTDGLLPGEVLGVVSLIIWALILVVTFKYVLLLMRADNRGEGGTLSLMALAQNLSKRYSLFVLGCGIAGAALFYGDSILTPAISVLSAVEGLKLITPHFEPYVLPATLAIITVLFIVQSHGTGKVARWFGPIMVVWFVSIAAFAVPYILEYPEILGALFPQHGLMFFIDNTALGTLILGAVFLAVTGAEALYADMGHFGKKPIRFAWTFLAFPCLALNYLGQGALVLHDPAAAENPFYLLAPSWALLPLVVLATMATIIASQAVITGAYSITQQAIQLKLLPRMQIRYTSESQAGQIYIPEINTLLWVGVVVLVVEFKSSSALASAYGIAVSGTMIMTTLLAFLVIWKLWRKPLWLVVSVIAPFLLIDSAFFFANLLKFTDGGYVPILIGGALMVSMWVWVRGTDVLVKKSLRESVPLKDLVTMLKQSRTHRVAGTAVFLTSEPETAPAALMHNIKHNKVIHEKNVVMTVKTEITPRVAPERRVEVEVLDTNMYLITLRFGFMESPNIPKALKSCKREGMQFDIMSTSFFLGRRTLKSSVKSGLRSWRNLLYITLARNAANATDFYHIPAGRVVEMGTQMYV